VCLHHVTRTNEHPRKGVWRPRTTSIANVCAKTPPSIEVGVGRWVRGTVGSWDGGIVVLRWGL
jgi:hypothetical protein